PPVITKLGVYNRAISVYDQQPQIVVVKRSGDVFAIPKGIIHTGFRRVGFSIAANDRVSASTNPNGIYSAALEFDGEAIVGFALDSIGYDATSYVDAQVDFKHKAEGGGYLQQLFRLPGNHGPVYHRVKGDGTIDLWDTAVHRVKITVEDARKNKSVLIFSLQYNGMEPLKEDRKTIFAPETVNVLEQPDFEVYLPEDALYDSVRPVFSRSQEIPAGGITRSFVFGDPSVPLHGHGRVRLRLPALVEGLSEKMVVEEQSKSRLDILPATIEPGAGPSGWAGADFDQFGRFRVIVDTQPPSISGLLSADTTVIVQNQPILINVRDNSGVRAFTGKIDGRWVLFTNDKKKTWIYRPDVHVAEGAHRLSVTATDIVGNVTVREGWIRWSAIPVPRKRPPLIKHKKNKRNDAKTRR
ncbi:MAG TPA: hypothetical protein VGC95_01720, partial [Chitinophagaceae bacterium]